MRRPQDAMLEPDHIARPAREAMSEGCQIQQVDPFAFRPIPGIVLDAGKRARAGCSDQFKAQPTDVLQAVLSRGLSGDLPAAALGKRPGLARCLGGPRSPSSPEADPPDRAFRSAAATAPARCRLDR